MRLPTCRKAVLVTVTVLVAFAAKSTADDIYWWKYPGSDCSRVDVKPQPSCAGTGSPEGNVSALEACCLSTPDCVGFNTHNVLKTDGCSHRIKGGEPCDLYLKQTTPQPPGPKPYPAPPSQRQSVGLWPLPRNASNGIATLSLSSSFAIHSNSPGSAVTPTLDAVVDRYTKLILLHGTPSSLGRDEYGNEIQATLSSCSVTVTSAVVNLTRGMDESYTLDVGESGNCSILAATFVGAMYGLETLSQLVLSDGPDSQTGKVAYTLPQAPWHVEDKPRFVYRGLMVDTSRHFLPLNALKRQLDALSFNKMNVLHWHMTDAQSTPYDSQAFPQLKEGAFSPRLVYSPQDVTELVEYARLRGVQILMEIDMPGHNYAFGIGYPDLIVNCSAMYPLETEFWCSSFALYRGEVVYEFLEKFLSELAALLPNAVFHIGGDEVQYQCWNSDPQMVAYLKQRNMTGVELYAEFEGRVMAMLAKLGKAPMFWNSVYDAKVPLPDDAVVHSYQGGTTSLKAIATAGHKVVESGLSGYYLAKQASWDSIFKEELMPQGLSADAQANVLGGEACMWGETMDDSDIDTIVWPGAAAVAERVWSSPGSENPDAYDSSSATLRLIPHRCRLYQRGIRAKPVDDRDGFGRRRLQAQCEALLPNATAISLPPLSAQFASD